MNIGSIRLNKYISESGICSRREADRYIEQGNVYINGKRATVGDQVSIGDVVKVNGQPIDPREEENFIFIALNKPVGVVSTTESAERNNIVDFVNHSTRIFPIGRLDKDSQGLIFLTNNGDLVNKILRAGNNHEKEYVVTVNKPITDAFITGMAAGVPILGVITRKCKIEKINATTFKLTLVQGLNRQIRRMCDHFKYDVVKLERTRIMNVSMKGLATGDWRDLDTQELAQLLALTENSTSQSSKSNTQSKAKHKSKPKARPRKPSANNADSNQSGAGKSSVKGGRAKAGASAKAAGNSKKSKSASPKSKNGQSKAGKPALGKTNKPVRGRSGGASKPARKADVKRSSKPRRK